MSTSIFTKSSNLCPDEEGTERQWANVIDIVHGWVQTCAPMKRGLKAKLLGRRGGLAKSVQTCAPMKRGLKATFGPACAILDVEVQTCAPMKRGLKGDTAENG